MKITICQINPTVGDITGNSQKIIKEYQKAVAEDSDIVVFGEHSIIGYSPEDLVLRPGFQRLCADAVKELAKATAKKSAAMLVGGILKEKDKLYNATFLLAGGKIAHTFKKHALPNYGVFDEERVFDTGPAPKVVKFKGAKIAFLICEDMWREEVQKKISAQKPSLIIVTNASPYELNKRRNRTKFAANLAKKAKAPIVYVNLVGGQDELVFDGNSFVMDKKGEIIHNLPAFEEFSETVEFVKEARGQRPEARKKELVSGIWYLASPTFRHFPSSLESIYQALVLGLRDYVNKNGFKGVILGLSGGIDSALTVAVAVDALGNERVHGVMLPSQYTSKESFTDAEESAKLLGIQLDTISIEKPVEAFKESLSAVFKGMKEDITEENLQARARAVMLMALSNKLGYMLLTTGNKSEISVGYSTLYGDLCGGYSVLKDVYKTTVYKLSEYRNKCRPKIASGPEGRVIPQNSITRAPTAELRPNQKDQDTLPPYDELDEILQRMVEKQQSIYTIIAAGFEEKVVKKVATMLYRAEYKRRQAAPGVKISGMAFGRDRRYPITNRFVN